MHQEAAGVKKPYVDFFAAGRLSVDVFICAEKRESGVVMSCADDARYLRCSISRSRHMRCGRGTAVEFVARIFACHTYDGEQAYEQFVVYEQICFCATTIENLQFSDILQQITLHSFARL